MDFEQKLIEDFVFMLDLCKDPLQVFEAGSDELKLAELWMDRLCRYECDNLSDRRIANLYISHLCAALVEGKLYGPFLKEPPKSKLERVDFHAVTPSIEASLTSTTNCPYTDISQVSNQYRDTRSSCPGMETAEQVSLNITNQNLSFDASNVGNFSQLSGHCPPATCHCRKCGSVCTCNRSSAGAEFSSPRRENEEMTCNYLMQELNITPGCLQNFDATLSSLMDLCKSVSLEGHSDTEMLSQVLASSVSTLLPKHRILSKDAQLTTERQIKPIGTTSTPDDCGIRDDISELLQAISAELCGDSEPGSSDYLERELARYKMFIMSHSNLAAHLEAQTSDMKLRHFLLVNLQNDLIKLLSEDFSEMEKN